MYVLLAIVLMAMDHRGQFVPRLRAQANYLVDPIYHVVEWPIRALRGTWSFFQNTQSLIRKNDNLADQLLAQQADLQRFTAMNEENHRLRALLDGSEKLDIEFQFAELIDVDLDPFSHRVVIDRGKDRGVELGQAVIDGSGVMGQVEEVSLHFSRVRLITDPNHALPVQISRTGLRTVAFGMGNTARLSLPSLPREADVREGDLLETSGLGGRFPGGYPVAIIEVIDRDEGRMFAEALARPLAALDRGREVLLLKAVPAQQLPPLGEALPVADEAGGVIDDGVIDDGVTEDALTDDAIAEDAVREDAVTADGVTEDGAEADAESAAESDTAASPQGTESPADGSVQDTSDSGAIEDAKTVEQQP